jgi:two-component system, OmpR family, response regulator ChvI
LRLNVPTIAVVDDDGDVLTLIKEVLKEEGYDVLLYDDGRTALDAFEINSPDLIVSDIRMPHMDGVELLRRVRQKSAVPIIFLTGRQNEVDELLGLRVGADDYIRKPFSPRVLVERVRTVLRRLSDGHGAGGLEPAGVIDRGHLRLDKERHICTWRDNKVVLTVTEFRLLETLASRPGVIKSRDALRNAAYGEKINVDDRTIDSHIKRLRKKFRTVDVTFDRIESLYGVGYVFKE